MHMFTKCDQNMLSTFSLTANGRPTHYSDDSADPRVVQCDNIFTDRRASHHIMSCGAMWTSTSPLTRDISGVVISPQSVFFAENRKKVYIQEKYS